MWLSQTIFFYMTLSLCHIKKSLVKASIFGDFFFFGRLFQKVGLISPQALGYKCQVQPALLHGRYRKRLSTAVLNAL